MFGIAECARADLAVELLDRGDAEAFGGLWQVSHDGDRVASHDATLGSQPFTYDVSDARLQQLAQDLRSGDPERVAEAQLHVQPGAYACSTPKIDRIVDIARSVPGVRGAQIAGAGLGGCAMILVTEDARDPLMRKLVEHGHEASEYSPVEGAGPIGL
jgi:galactokinase